MISSEVLTKISLTNRKAGSRRSTHLVCSKPRINKLANRTVVKQRVVKKRLLPDRLSSTELGLPIKTKRYDTNDVFNNYAQLPYWPGHFEAYSLWGDVQDLDRWENQSYHGIKILKPTPFHHGLPQQKTRFKQFCLRENILSANFNNRPSLKKHLSNSFKPVKPWHLIGMDNTRQNRDSGKFTKFDEMETVLNELFPEYALSQKLTNTSDQALPCVTSGLDNRISDQTTSNSTDNGVKPPAAACHKPVDDDDDAVPYVSSDDTGYHFRALRLLDDEDVEMPYVPSGDLENDFLSSECQDITRQNTTHCQSYNNCNKTTISLFDDEDVEMPYLPPEDVDDGYFSGEDQKVASESTLNYHNINGNATVRRLFDDEDVEMPYVPTGEFNDGYSSDGKVSSEHTRHQLYINSNAAVSRLFDDEGDEMSYISTGDFNNGYLSGDYSKVTSKLARNHQTHINDIASDSQLLDDEDVEMPYLSF